MDNSLNPVCHQCSRELPNTKYKNCYKCNFKKCEKCNKRNVKTDSSYKICYNCNKVNNRRHYVNRTHYVKNNDCGFLSSSD